MTDPMTGESLPVNQKRCCRCGSSLTPKGNCARTVAMFSRQFSEPTPLDPVIAQLISKHITPTSATGKAIAARIAELVNAND